jgi:hypothetical protein
MSDRQLRIQHDEIKERNRQQREAQMREAQRLADERRNRRHN